MTLTEKTGHLAWCALVALALARQRAGRTLSRTGKSLSHRWLAAALKQRRFSRDVAQDIGWLLNQGRLLGVRAKLADKLGYVWRSCGELTEQNDMFRLVCAGNSERHGLELPRNERQRMGRTICFGTQSWSKRCLSLTDKP
jgi:hypothetical protein